MNIRQKERIFFSTHAIIILSLFTYSVCDEKVKKDVNRDSRIASSPISQSSFFKGVRCLILASSQRKLRRYIEFL